MENNGRPEFDIDESKTAQEQAIASPLLLSRGYGVGEMPDDVRRFNWGAFLLMPFWGVAYGLPSVLAWWSMTYFLPLAVSSLVEEATAASTLAGISAVLLVITSTVKLWVGMNANTWLWRREHFRLEALNGIPPRFTIQGFFQRQRKWIIVGIALLALSFVSYGLLALSVSPEFVAMREQFNITPMQLSVSAGWTLAETLLALWLASKLRQPNMASPSASGGQG